MKKADIFRKKYPIFIYRNHSYRILRNNLKISFSFIIKGKDTKDFYFSPFITIKNLPPKTIKRILSLSPETVNNFIFHLGLIEMLSYWKVTCSPLIVVEANYLTEKQILWWQDLIKRGMGQFFYENQINFKKENFLKIVSGVEKNNLKVQKNSPLNKNKILIAVGGGKDSIVTLELFKPLKKEKEIYCFSLNPDERIKKIIKTAGYRKTIFLERKIDKNLLKLNQKGFLNGHTPFSAYLAFLSCFLGLIFDIKYLVFSNERSAEEENIYYLGEKINHQYSKTFDFEKKFRQYSKKYLHPQLEYFSVLRPLYEIEIAKKFSLYKKYFSLFLSCNEAKKTFSGTKKPTGRWCGLCSKCLSVFTLLYPFLERKKIIKIFKKNLFQEKKLIPLMNRLVGKASFKPFECLATKKEMLTAFYLSLKKEEKEGRKKLPLLLEYFKKEIGCRLNKKQISQILKSFGKSFIPSEFKKLLKEI